MAATPWTPWPPRADVVRGGVAADRPRGRRLHACAHPGGENALLDFFVAAPGKGLDLEPAELTPIDVAFAEDAVQRFNVGPSSCGAYGTTRGLAHALERFGSVSLADLTERPAKLAREGVEVVRMQAFLFTILEPILRSTPEAGAIYAPGGELLREGDLIRLPELGDLLERLGSEGHGFLYEGDVAAAVSDWVLARGGLITREDLATYDVVEREPVSVHYEGRTVLTNPPPSSGGILIADALGILERLERPHDAFVVAEVIASTNRARDEEFLLGLATEGYLEQFLAKDALDSVATDVRSRLGNTTHLAVMDADGACASVTCSNGSCSGVVVPGTGVHLNNMLGEQDLNPHGYHRYEPGVRVPSMMSPTVVLRDGQAELALGSAGSNRIRSAILQTILAVVDDGVPAEEAVRRPRLPGGGRGGGRAGGGRGGARPARGQRLDGAPLERAEPVLRRRAGRSAERRHRRAHRRRRSRRGGVAEVAA